MSASYRPTTPAPSSSGKSNFSFQKPSSSFYVFQPRPALPSNFQNAPGEFDGKRLRKAVARRTVDYNSSVVKMLEQRLWQRDFRDRRIIQPDIGYYTQMIPPMQIPDNPANCITTKFVRTSTNKMRCPIFCVLWTPEGRRLVTGASSGEFTLWNGLTFNFETILQAHDSAVKVMVWSHNDSWMVTADQTGYVKYWQSNMNNVKMFQAHKEPVRAISFCPTDTKFATCSDDGTVRLWDFLRCHEERILRGHGADVKGVDWHPTKALIASGSKDSQQPVKLWDPKSGQSLATLHAHKNTVTDVKWNQNGNWLLTSSRDHLIKIFDIRNMSSEMQAFRGHKKEVSCLSWHPIHEGLFSSGGSDGSILFWLVGTEKEIGAMEQAHDSIVWSLSWHPLGHILTSGSNDHSCKFWTRNRPGDKMRDKYNLNLLPKESDEAAEYEEEISSHIIPGMGFGDRNGHIEEELPSLPIPGLGFDRVDEENSGNEHGGHHNSNYLRRDALIRKVPYSKPIPKQFQQQWNCDTKPPVSLRNERRPEPYFSQNFDSHNSPNSELFQQTNPSTIPNLEFFNHNSSQFQLPPPPPPPPPQPLPPPFFNGNEQMPSFGGHNHGPPNPGQGFPEFRPNLPSPNFNSNPIPPSFFGAGNPAEQFPPFSNQQPQAPFGNNPHFPNQPANYNQQAGGYPGESHERPPYEQPNYPVSKRVRS